MSALRVTRRRVLALGCSVALVATGALAACRRSMSIFGEARPELREGLESVLTDPEATRRLGAAYLQSERSEASIDRLLVLLPIPGRTADAAAAAAAADPGAVLAHVGSATPAEFADGDTVVVDGWELARSEARLAGLYAALSA